MNAEFKTNPFKRSVRVIDVLEITEKVMSEHWLNDDVAIALATVFSRILQKVEDDVEFEQS